MLQIYGQNLLFDSLIILSSKCVLSLSNTGHGVLTESWMKQTVQWARMHQSMMGRTCETNWLS